MDKKFVSMPHFNRKSKEKREKAGQRGKKRVIMPHSNRKSEEKREEAGQRGKKES